MGRCFVVAVILLAWPAGAEIFVASNDRVLVFADDADGDVAPLRSILRDPDPMGDVCCLALDLPRRELYVGAEDGVHVFSMDASGEVVPLRSLSGATTTFDSPRGVALDHLQDELYVANTDAHTVVVFPRTASGNVAPTRILGGANSFDTNGFPSLLFLDLVHDELYVSVRESGAARVHVFTRAASGDAIPVRTLTGLGNPRSVLVDLDRDELIVTERDQDAVAVFARTASGSASRLRTIEGAATGFASPSEAVVTADGELLVGNDGIVDTRFVGHDVGANGDATPLRWVTGATTELLFPIGIVSTRAKECSAGRAVDGCLFRDNFEGTDLCAWSDEVGGSSCN